MVPIGALNNLTTMSNYSVVTTIKSLYNGYQKTLEFLAVPAITDLTPEQQIHRGALKISANIQLADPEFHKPASVDLLLGAGTSLSALAVGQIRLSTLEEPELILQKTQLGWIIGGSHSLKNKASVKGRCHIQNIQHDISRFWEIEEGSSIKHLSPEEAACEDHFVKHVIRKEDGRYIVALPFNNKLENLGESLLMASKRLQSLERRFSRYPDLKQQYTSVIEEYLKLGYMTRIAENPIKGYYLPHQAVIKETSLTTKVRVVFDGSATSTSGLSLNDALMSGPTIQDDIFSLLLRFRLHYYVLTGDIEKMYLQVLIRKEDQPYLLILWRDDNNTISTFKFNRLIFGLKPASFLATRCLHQLADDEKNNYPFASRILKKDLYVDDLLTGANTVEEVVQLHKDITGLLQSGGFNLRQCASNSHEVLQTIPDTNVNLQLQSGDNTTLKTLGVHWNSSQDAIIYTVQSVNNLRATKRIICSDIAKIFDPLGLLNPVIVTAKLIMQELWKLQLDWDESLPMEISTRWQNFITQLPELDGISFARLVISQQSKNVQLHGFCDASEKAYGACIYLRTEDFNGDVHIHLFCAKSRVAPIKTIQTIPRLELCAAALLSQLYSTVKNAINLEIHHTFFWSDSTIVLHWIKASPHTLKTFVANRVVDIQTRTQTSHWRHVPTHDNPADLLSRGMMPNELKKSSLWSKGPCWLTQEMKHWPQLSIKEPVELLEIRKPKCLNIKNTNDNILHRFSSFRILQRVIALCLRWRNLKNDKGSLTPKDFKNVKGALTPEDLKKATSKILWLVQHTNFNDEITKLKTGQEISTKSKILALNPFLDKDQLLRVGGRLQHSTYEYNVKHPVLLPKSHHVTRLLIEHIHKITFHGGLQATLYALRQQYWLIDGRSQVRQVLRNCIRCARVNPSPTNYVMGHLPGVRTAEVRPFTNTGVDYCGPFYIKEKKLRNRNKVKTYVSIFICLSTKAVHIEVVSDLTTEGFLAALKRFIARRGMCASIYSDNATNFVGANNELKELGTLLTSKKHNEATQNFLSDRGINWKFSPPQSPHFGGIWEAAVKSFKYHFKRVASGAMFTFEQLNTLAIEIEAILNSRPLTPLSSDPHDLSALTPAHFLIGENLISLPENDWSITPINHLSAWQHLQKVKQDFWKRWHKEYINELNIRRKWCKGSHPIKENSIVLLRDDNLPPSQWKLGRVMETYPGHDGIIRTVLLKTQSGQLVRGVKKLAVLPVPITEST